MAFNLVNYSLSSDQPKVLFLHGFLGNHADFDPVISLTPFHCVSIDLPGHGKTQFSGEYTLPNTAAAIVEFLDRLAIESIHLVGYSMGGRLALYLALNYPNRFPTSVIESGSPGLKTEFERSQRLQSDRDLAHQIEIDFEQFLINWYDQPLFRSFKAHPDFEQQFKARSRNNPIELARSLREMSPGLQPNLWEQLRLHHNPILLLVGEYDRKFVEINQAMASICESAILSIVPKVGHNIHFENPNLYVDRLLRFIS